jgi:prefoldin subunit 2
MATTQPAAAGEPTNPTSPVEPELTTEQEIIEGYNRLRQEQSNIMSQIAQAEGERHEHGLVLDALKPLEPERRCHRLVGGVLVERTVAEVLPMIDNSCKQLDLLLKNLSDELGKKDNKLNAFMTKYKIRVKGQNDGPQVQAKEAVEGAKTGVLA